MTANQQNMRQPYDGWSLDERDPEVIKSMMPLWEWFYRYYFRNSSRLPVGDLERLC